MKVSNLTNYNGNAWQNQFTISTKAGRYLQSYRSLVAYVGDKKILLGKDWDYSKTTMKAVSKFLTDLTGYKITATELRKALARGVFEGYIVALANLDEE